MQNTIVVREADFKDITGLYGLMREYIVDFYNRPEPSEEDLKGLIRHLLENPASGLQFVAEENGNLLGFATLYFTFSTLKVKRQAILNDLYVSTDARGKKVGESLFQACLGYIREHDFAGMTWETAKDNDAAQALYEKMGGEISEWLVYEIK
ncbi:GCN5 family acetyltransferase [Bacillus sp. FJAT-27225]|uniref:GNAT family N-acetyltransferase n=1 Tax=Bacillus sp. FJAT-27225 TaxID=1743144 RepID=UPI00080C2DEA|nr:GNAT family N-acetyltransferase [Bacillus sp. FJAT-27225]OCA84192.1 GCN5 family acetyltransferase [Bacillus sp. FJAT-27225]